MNDLIGRVFRDGNKLLYVTSESPRQFDGFLLAVYQGITPESVVETARAVPEFQGFDEVDKTTLSKVWQLALRIPAAESKPADTRSKPHHKRLERVSIVYLTGVGAMGAFAFQEFYPELVAACALCSLIVVTYRLSAWY